MKLTTTKLAEQRQGPGFSFEKTIVSGATVLALLSGGLLAALSADTAHAQSDLSLVGMNTQNVDVDLSVLEDSGYGPHAVGTPQGQLLMPSRQRLKSRLLVPPVTRNGRMTQPKQATLDAPVIIETNTGAPRMPRPVQIPERMLQSRLEAPSATPRSSLAPMVKAPAAKMPSAPAPVKAKATAKKKAAPKKAPKMAAVSTPPPAPPAPRTEAPAPKLAPAKESVKKVETMPAPAPAPMPKAEPKAEPAPMTKAEPVPMPKAEKAPPPPPVPVPEPEPLIAKTPKAAPEKATETVSAPPPPPAPVTTAKAEPKRETPKVTATLPPPAPAEPKAEMKAPVAAPVVVEQAALPPAGGAIVPGRALDVVFQANASKLPNTFKSALKGLAARLAKQEDFRLQLLAYAGGEGLSASAARRMSLSRALEVRSFLIENGLRSTRIDVRALGNKTSEAEPNRVDVNIIER